MIDRPSLLETPNLANKSTFIESPVPGESVDDCYAWDSLIRGDYDGTDLAEWENGKQIQETLPAAQWDAMIHDITALSYQLSQVCNSLWEEMYCIIHGAQAGMSQEAITQLLSGAQTFTNKTISFDDNTLQNIASLDTAQTLKNKTISFDDNTLQNVASLNTAQTLKNKTIDKKDNIIKCSATVISTTPYTLTPTKEMNCIIDVASGVITLGSGPYQGYELPILAKQDCTVSYIGAGGSTSDNLTANQVTSYIWNGSAWIQNGVSIKPIFISTSGSVAPTSEANYVIDTTSVTLTVQNGVYVGQKVWVTSNATGSQMWYTGINGSTLIGIQNGEIARMTWNGTYWFCEIIAIITGKDAQGNAFTYGGGVGINVNPALKSIQTVTANNTTLDATNAYKFIININDPTPGISLGSGAFIFQEIEILSLCATDCAMSYTSLLGAASTDYLRAARTNKYTWTGSYWFCSSCPVAIGDVWKQYPDTDEPAHLYGGQWQLHGYGGAYERGQGTWTMGFTAKITGHFTNATTFIADSTIPAALDVNGNNRIAVGGTGTSRIVTAISGTTVTVEDVGNVWASATYIVVLMPERLPNIVGYLYVDDVNNGTGAIRTYDNQGYGPAGGYVATTRHTAFDFNASRTTGTGNGVYKDNAHVQPNTIVTLYWIRTA